VRSHGILVSLSPVHASYCCAKALVLSRRNVIEAAALDVIVLAQEHYVIGAAAQSARQCRRQAGSYAASSTFGFRPNDRV
jgi:hypothetical protein